MDIVKYGQPSSWPKEFRYTLIYKGVETVLKYEPDTWMDFSLAWKVDTLFWTRALSLGLPTKFVKDGKQIIDQAYREQGVNASVMFRIEQFDYATGVWAYRTLYYNKLNFASYISEQLYVELESEPQGLMNLLARKGNQELEIDMSDGVMVSYDRIEFNQYGKYHVENDKIIAGTFTPTITIDEESAIEVRGVKNVEFQSTGIIYGSEDDIINAGMYFMKCNRSTLVKLSMNIMLSINFSQSSLFAAPVGGTSCKVIDKYKKIIFEAPFWGWQSSGDIGGIITYSTGSAVLFEKNMTLDAGNEYYIIFSFSFSGIENPKFESYFSSIGEEYRNITTWKYRGDSKQINTINPEQLGKRLLEKITEGYDGAYDFQFPGYNQFAVTCGDAIRGNSDAKIKTTFNDFFRTYSRLFQLGLDIVLNGNGSESAVMKPLESFFEGDNVTDLGEVTELRVRPWVDKIPNTISVGYDDNSYENADGKGEFNTELQFSTPLASKTNKLDLMIPYRADSYGVEYVLIDFEKDETADSKADNDVFLMHLNGSVVSRGVPTISGTYADSTMFNASLSPKTVLRRNGRLISSLLDKIQPVNGKNIIFGSSKKNMDVAIGGIHERRSELVSDEQMFRPIIFDFYTGIKNFSAYELMRKSPNGIFKFSFMGRSYKGYILELQVKPAKNQAQDWQMICHPNTEV